MGQRITSTEHRWEMYCTIPIDKRRIPHAVRYGNTKFDVDTRVEVLDIICQACRRLYEDVADEPCQSSEGNEHLIGGPGTRKKRKHDDHDCDVMGCVTDVRVMKAAAAGIAVSRPA